MGSFDVSKMFFRLRRARLIRRRVRPDGVALMASPSEINPYAPPATDGESLPAVAGAGAVARALFSPRQMLAATVFGSIISGLILLQANFRAMDRARDANRTVIFGLLASAALFALLFMLPARIPATPVNIAAALAFYKLAETMQGKAFSEHRAAGGARQSNWLVFGITLGTAVVLLVTLFLILMAAGGPGFDVHPD